MSSWLKTSAQFLLLATGASAESSNPRANQARLSFTARSQSAAQRACGPSSKKGPTATVASVIRNGPSP